MRYWRRPEFYILTLFMIVILFIMGDAIKAKMAIDAAADRMFAVGGIYDSDSLLAGCQGPTVTCKKLTNGSVSVSCSSFMGKVGYVVGLRPEPHLHIISASL
jgi:hypothetical protein